MSWISDVRAKLKELDQSRRALVKYGRTMAVALLILGALVFFFGEHRERGYWVGAVGIVFLIFSWLAPGALKLIHKGWMTFAFAIGWVMSRVILTVFFFVAITPVGLIMRLVGKNPLTARSQSDSYWIRREAAPRDPSDYERLF